MNSHPTKIWTRSFISIFLATLLIFTAFYLLLPTLPLYIISNLKTSTTNTGIALAAYTIAALLIRPVTGFMIDMYGRKWIYLISVLLFALMFAGYELAITVMGMIMLRFLHGLLWGVTTTSGNTIAVDLVPMERRGEGLGYFGLSGTIPMAIGPMIGLWLIANGTYQQLFIASVVIGFAGFLIATMIKVPGIKHKSTFSFRNLIEITTLPVALVLLINMISYGGLVSFISLYVKETGEGNAGLFFLVYATGIAAARLTSGKIFDRKGPVLLAVISLISLFIGFIILALIHQHLLFLLSAFLLGMGSGIISPTLQTMANNMVKPHRRGAANSTLFTALDLGIGIGMMLTGFLAGNAGLSNTFLLFSVLNIVALVLFLSIAQKHYHLNKI
ncbi:MAG: MFS transporter [Bacteroidetes bacterium]|nr:MFS transporter [Bacteroidota bacterium]